MRNSLTTGKIGGFVLGLVLGIGLLGGAAMAQSKGQGAQHGQFGLGGGHGQFGRGAGMGHFGFGLGGRMAQALGLTDAQKAQIKTIVQDAHKQRQAIWNNDKQSLGAAKAQLKSLAEETRTRVEAVLTAEQKAKIANWKKGLQNRLRNRGGGQVPPSS